ncbi:hypothetical protein F9B74_08945 [Pelistega sp. NLN82]|uniref:Sugar efflux transporter for intercellular exchange n=1 Tax=Pelistega ratti TaxID=2652177 RepID=A0A6L9Y8A1_9BURK|nr:SemiSWEET family transporter [Pelistega ratti]NEN76435.1 hypothetical protein [Pelistega ratti]
MTNQRFITILGYVATFTAICMYVSYLQQIDLNLSGQKGGPLQPLATTINCTLWVIYGLFKEKRDWPIAIANFPGVILGAITFITAL